MRSPGRSPTTKMTKHATPSPNPRISHNHRSSSRANHETPPISRAHFISRSPTHDGTRSSRLNLDRFGANRKFPRSSPRCTATRPAPTRLREPSHPLAFREKHSFHALEPGDIEPLPTPVDRTQQPMKGTVMRFKRWPPRTEFEDTPRKRAALLRNQRKQRSKFPLLAEIIADEQPDADTVMNRRSHQWRHDDDRTRQRRADAWRRARARLFAYDPLRRHEILTLWRTSPYPADPSYLLDFLDALDKGRIDPANPPWIYRGMPFNYRAESSRAP